MGKRKSQTQTAATPLAEMSDRTSAFNSNDNIPQTMPFSQENSAQNTAEGFVLPTAKETMAAQGNGANANATAMDMLQKQQGCFHLLQRHSQGFLQL